MVLALTSKTMTQGQMYDAASNILAQRLSQLSGIGNVNIGGSSLPAVRVELNPQALYNYGIGLEDVRAALASANANSPKGTIDDGDRRFQIYTNDQANVAADYAPLVIAYRNGAAVRLSDVAEVVDSVQDNRNLGMSDGQPSVLVILYRQPNANIIETVDAVKAELPHLEAAMPADMNVNVAIDRSTTIRASLHDTELTLVLAVMLVTVVVFLFLRNVSATIIPSVAVPISIFGTFGVMYLLGYSLDILSLMALTIATGFVVDDAIVVMENIARHMEEGMPRLQAAFRGAREVGFTVLSISLSLIMVFLPILLMGGILGRLFREFTVTLSIAILVSLVISLTTTPMLCALFLKTDRARGPEGRPSLFERVRIGYGHTLTWALRHSLLVLAIFIATIGLNVYLFYRRAEGLFSPAGHRPHHRLAAGRPKHLVPGDEREAQADDRHRACRSGRRYRRGLHRRRQRRRFFADQHRHGVRVAQADLAAGDGGRSASRGCARNSHRCRAGGSISPRCRICAPAGARATRNINTRCNRRTCRISTPGRRNSLMRSSTIRS